MFIPHKLEDLNQMNQQNFTQAIGSIFEHSPWIAEKAWVYRPFNTVYELHEKMVEIVKNASNEKKLQLIRAHPDLARRVKMTQESTEEQKGAGLTDLSEKEQEEFISLNKLYTENFNFPFIMAVQGKNKSEIKEAMQQRVQNNYETEFNKALEEIYKIARFRLDKLVY